MPADVTGKSLGDEASWQTRDGVRLDIFSFEISRTVSTSDPPVSRKKKPWTAAVTSRVGGGGGLQRRYISARGDWPEMVNSCYPFPPRRFRRPAFLPSAASLTRYGLPAWTSMVRPRRQAATKSPRNGGPHAGHFVLHQGHWINENGRLAEREGRPLMGGPPIHSVKVRWGVQVSATSAGASKGLHGRGGDIGTARSAGCFRGGPGVQLPRE